MNQDFAPAAERMEPATLARVFAIVRLAAILDRCESIAIDKWRFYETSARLAR
jgi:hypothetical protein